MTFYYRDGRTTATNLVRFVRVTRAVLRQKLATLFFLIDVLPENFEWVVFVILLSRIEEQLWLFLLVFACIHILAKKPFGF